MVLHRDDDVLSGVQGLVAAASGGSCDGGMHWGSIAICGHTLLRGSCGHILGGSNMWTVCLSMFQLGWLVMLPDKSKVIRKNTWEDKCNHIDCIRQEEGQHDVTKQGTRTHNIDGQMTGPCCCHTPWSTGITDCSDPLEQ